MFSKNSTTGTSNTTSRETDIDPQRHDLSNRDSPMNKSEPLANLVEDFHKVTLLCATHEPGVSAEDALRAAAGMAGLALLRSIVPEADLEVQEPGIPYFNAKVAEQTHTVIARFLDAANHLGLGADPETGWSDILPPMPTNFEPQHVLLSHLEPNVRLIARQSALSWQDVSMLFTFVSCRLLKEVEGILPLRGGKALIMNSFIAGAKTVPLPYRQVATTDTTTG